MRYFFASRLPLPLPFLFIYIYIIYFFIISIEKKGNTVTNISKTLDT
nr:MAG TPA: hypothetical protein [Caudoviricetes sp.]DAU96916.1 MAG TPA: hypothetical protein [Caudoviricetes sp.]